MRPTHPRTSHHHRGAWLAVVLVFLFAAACGEDTSSSSPPASDLDAGAADSGGDAAEDAAPGEDAAADAAPDVPPAALGFCAPCDADGACGVAGDLCLQLPYGQGGRCGVDCAADPTVCPSGSTCAELQAVPAIRQCVPDLLLCENPCDALECENGEVCHPATGSCGPPLAFCAGDCLVDAECGGAGDRCLTLPDTGEAFCAQDCSADGACPSGAFCAAVGAEEDNVRQCVPEALTCVDRCQGVACDAGEGCDPRTGACAPRLGLCDGGCEINALCGTSPDDLCVALGTPDDESICATGCDDSPDCPVDYFCAGLDGRERGVCIPLEVTCRADRCDGVDCGPDANCEPRTGGCVPREATLCGACDSGDSATCGGPADLCLNLGESAGIVCTQDCSGSGVCPEGYDCLQLNNSTRRACIPVGGDCARCQGVVCEDGIACNPLTGACALPPTSCVDTPCAEGSVCNTTSGQCEVIDAACTFNMRVEDCFGPVRKCSATRPDSAGVCALICADDADCSAAAPDCVELYRVGRLCVQEVLGGAATCGVAAPASASIGRPCGAGVTASCPAAAPICLTNVEPAVSGVCTQACASDADCNGEGTCQEVRGRGERLCLPENCACLGGGAVPGGVEDLTAAALVQVGADRCSFGLTPGDQRVLPAASLTAPLRVPGVAGWVAQPLAAISAGDALRQELVAAAAGASPARDALIAAASRMGLRLEARAPVWTLPEGVHPVEAGLRRLAEAAGGAWSLADLQGELQAIPAGQAVELGRILYAMAAVVEARRGLGLDDAQLQRLYAAAPGLALRLAADAPLLDLQGADRALLEGLELAPLVQAGADLAATLEASALSFDPAWEGVSIRYASPVGLVILGGAGDTTWDPALDPTLAAPIALLLDVSGADTYRVAAGATTSWEQPVAVLLDLGGDDGYGYNEAASPLDSAAWLPSDAAGRRPIDGPPIRYDGPVSLSDTPRQGAGRLGVGVLMDRGAGADTYRSLRMSQGAGVLGVGLLVDDGGDDSYTSEALSQGAGLLGIGVLVDRGSAEDRNTLRGWHRVQGHGAPGGAGLLALTSGGADTLTAERGTGPADILYWSGSDRSLSNLNLAQGAGAGVAPADEREPLRQALSGGVGVLFDLGGDDRYTAGTWAQGVGLHRGAGLLLDRSGDDRYAARFGGQGAADTAAFGLLLDDAGADRYNLDSDRLVAALAGVGLNLAAGVLRDAGGDDAWRLPTFSGGAGLDNGLGALLDLGGADQWDARAASTLGAATLTAELAGGARGALPTWGLLLDAGPEADTWMRADLSGVPADPIGDSRAWTQRSSADPAVPERGVGIDGEGASGYEP